MVEKHTPGPWYFSASSEKGLVFDDANGYPIMPHYSGGESKPPRFIANARLIAAAPELLEALDGLNTYVKFHDSHAPYYTFNEDQAESIRAAIAKAKGEQP